ncbi:ABC transporter ATP-binding protein [Streptacidiphilus carbonis]|uniref:ABC transporter ATP-binding protein n=1 Tax=Streptacidiphilus carbonis TaxID=105422 RepID=UPI0006931D07|nr:ABC transporter ATP-binding protein [Streptacidiphilus carbonis]
MDNAIHCEGLTKQYGPTLAVDHLDLTVGPAQVFGFLGPNGSGKTTTMRMLLGLVHPTSGRAWIHGRPLPDPDGLARIGSMIEEPGFHPWASGRRNLEFLALSGPPVPRTDAVDRALHRVGLATAADRHVRTYSQGMRQRLGLAAALLRDPSLLILDEPTNGLDPAGIQEMRALLRTLADAGTTVFLSSHLLTEIEQVCDRVAVLHAGRLIEEGPVAEVAGDRAAVRVTVDPADLARAQQLLAAWPTHPTGPGQLLVDSGDPRAVNEVLGRAGLWAHELRRDSGGLENRFLHLTADTRNSEVSDAPAPR